MYLATALLGALGGARPTGIAGLDAVLLAAGGVAVAACARRARTAPVVVAAGLAAATQPALVPQLLGVVGLVAALARGRGHHPGLLGAVAGGGAWAALVGAPFAEVARPSVLPLLAMAWVGLSARRHGTRGFRHRLDRVALVVGGVVVVGTALGALSVVSARAHLERGGDLLESGLAAARLGETEAAIDELRAASRALGRGEATLGAPWARPAWVVPGVSQSTRALHAMADEVRAVAEVGVTSAEDADLESLRVRDGEVDLATIAAMEAPLVDVIDQLERSARRFAALRAGAVAPPITWMLDDLEQEVADALPSARLALDGVRAAPGLLGADGPRTYLVLFTTPVEARARTGFPGNYAELTLTDGRVERTAFGRVTDLARQGTPAAERTLSGPADYLARYGRFDPAADWRSLTFSPDFPTVARVAAELYPQAGGRRLDGVLSVDPTALAALLHFTGPITAPGVAQPLTSSNAADYLLRGQYTAFGDDNSQRIDALESLADLALERLTTGDLPGPRTLAAVLGPVVQHGNLQLATSSTEAEPFLDALGISGRLAPVEGDFLAVTTSNVAMNKIDVFLRRTLDYDVTWDPATGSVSAAATITLTNTAPAAGLPDYVIGNRVGANRPGGADLPTGSSYVFLTLYTPWAPTEATLDDEPIPVEVLAELGRNAVSTFVEVSPGASRTIRIELDGALTERRYLLDLAAQPLVTPERATVSVRSTTGGPLHGTGPVMVQHARAEGAFALVEDVRITLRP